LILEFEQTQSPEVLAGLRRILHTMKGEAGVMGLNAIGSFCHAAEECVDGGVNHISPDLLLEIKDWLHKAVIACVNGQAPENPPDLHAKRGVATERPVTGKVTPVVVAPVHGNLSYVQISDRELAKDFVGESQEHFDVADENLLVLENDPTNGEAVGAVFRAFHTVKGVSGFLGLTHVGDLAHVAETLLDEVRKCKRSFSGNAVEVTFNALDMLKTMMADLRQALVAGTEMPVRAELPPLIASIKAVLDGSDSSIHKLAHSVVHSPPVVNTGAAVPKDGGAAAVMSPVEIAPLKEVETTLATSPALTPRGQAESAPPKELPTREGVEVGQTMKVDAEKIDLLLDTIGELVIAESIVANDPEVRALRSLRVEKNMALLGKITRSLQDMGMAMRLVPIDATFRKMARLVRDLSKKSGKQVELIMEGGETEIDKGMVEKLGDPLVHMIRNSMDHGLENTEGRIASGKNPVGRITLRAYHKGGSIHIDIEDDGRGLDREAIVAKAIEKGLLTTGDGVSDQDVFALIFAAGFSTAKQITEISGRGVGMDVVRRNIDSLRGTIGIKSQPGQGTIFTITLPLTMAIIDGMLARVSSEIYVLPTLSIVESFRPAPEMISSITGKGEMVTFRDTLLPLFHLSNIFKVSGAIEDPSLAIVMVIEEAGRQWGLVVDEILGQQQIVIKSLGDAMGNVPGVSGASIMADGRPGLILDIAGLIRLATE
jgi:two-component system chemotaxis sensor kinase CheA